MDSKKISNEFYRKLGVEGLANLFFLKGKDEDIELVKKLCKKTDKILDLACGYGRVTIPLAKLGYDIIGLDLLPLFIKKAKHDAKKENLKVRFDVGSILKLPYANKTFDKIICLGSSLNHILTRKKQVKALNEIFRVLRLKSFAFIEMFNGESKLIRQKLKEEGRGPEKRLLEEGSNEIKTLRYFHDRRSLLKICRISKFEDFKVGFKNLYGQRRIVMCLYK